MKSHPIRRARRQLKNALRQGRNRAKLQLASAIRKRSSEAKLGALPEAKSLVLKMSNGHNVEIFRHNGELVFSVNGKSAEQFVSVKKLLRARLQEANASLMGTPEQQIRSAGRLSASYPEINRRTDPDQGGPFSTGNLTAENATIHKSDNFGTWGVVEGISMGPVVTASQGDDATETFVWTPPPPKPTVYRGAAFRGAIEKAAAKEAASAKESAEAVKASGDSTLSSSEPSAAPTPAADSPASRRGKRSGRDAVPYRIIGH